MCRTRNVVIAVFVLIAIVLTNCKHEPNDIIPVKKDTTSTPVPTPTPTINNVKDSVCYEDEIQPVLSSNCAKSGCHDVDGHSAGIILNSYENVMQTISGSFLLQVIKDTGSNKMPPVGEAQLSDAQITLIESWVNQGMKKGIDCLGDCDTTNITFSTTINPIIETYCKGCHTNTAPALLSYTDIKGQADNGKLICTTFHQDGCVAMPQGSSQLPYCKLRQLKKWVDAGAPNN